MSETPSEILELVQQKKKRLAGTNLYPLLAKLYSQSTRLHSGQPGIRWSNEETEERLNEAVLLIEIAFFEQQENISTWKSSLLRAAEILEWLSHPNINVNNYPLFSLASATYQLAGYGARATGLLKAEPTTNIHSDILQSFLQSSFPHLVDHIASYWGRNDLQELDSHISFESSDNLNRWLIQQTIGALGILCSQLRWGDEIRFKKALEKLEAISKVYLFEGQSFSWILAKLSSEIAKNYASCSLRQYISGLSNLVTLSGKNALERYARLNYLRNRALAWNSQILGIERLKENKSFALCTPTGSGKTTIAELAILTNLFHSDTLSDDPQSDINYPLAIYLVPSRALAAEVESKLSYSIKNATEKNIIVSGMYGGADWGPSDSWLNTNERTVLICTFEKAEALIKFLGPKFLRRISLIVIDEAHSVQFSGSENSLTYSENRSLTLESVCTRLFAYMNRKQGKIIALSAVAGEVDKPLASWVEGNQSAEPIRVDYRSTRQLIGRLECLDAGRIDIEYDLLDGNDLSFSSEGVQKPYIPNPFPPHPLVQRKEWNSGSKQLRPYLFWYAMHLASADESTKQKAVLISVTQQIGGYAADFLTLLDKEWSQAQLPEFFKIPSDSFKKDLWEKCLSSCRDYFGEKSREYNLLEKGIIVHHGKMPGLLQRLLIEVVEKGIVNIVLATSTLSEGVNLPFETVLLPSLERFSQSKKSQVPISESEFLNLVGRAGRPGYGTEGKCLVVLRKHASKKDSDYSTRRRRSIYEGILQKIKQNQETSDSILPQSPLSTLLQLIYNQWTSLSGSEDPDLFYSWLETTAPLDTQQYANRHRELLETSLDSLDKHLLATIVELEYLDNDISDPIKLEELLTQIWQSSYAFFTVTPGSLNKDIFTKRGVALSSTIYSDPKQRRALYLSSLPPKSGASLLNLLEEIREIMITGEEYLLWDRSKKFEYIQKLVEQISKVPKFELKGKAGGGKNPPEWYEVLRWWLDKDVVSREPTIPQFSSWHDYISKNFIYRFNWGLGSVISLSINNTEEDSFSFPDLDVWHLTGLPWIVYWVKELITWGTLDPIAAFLLSQRLAYTRSEAMSLSQNYYTSVELDDVDILDPRNVRKWIEENFLESASSTQSPPKSINASRLRDFSSSISEKQLWRVIPVIRDNQIVWFDLAGFALASSIKPHNWLDRFRTEFDFHLDISESIVSSKRYL